MTASPRGFVIAGTHSSVGKTSVTLGILRLLRQKNHVVQPFKVGPDYIDPAHHRQAAGVPSYNLDSWMCSKLYIKNLFDDIMRPGKIAVVEGVMGLFDGAYPTREQGTTAQIAKLLGLPVILVVDGSRMARSVAALVKGFTQFDPDLKISGVIANRVTTPGHRRLIESALKHHVGIKLLGNLPLNSDLQIKERHLGLHQSLEQSDNLYNAWARHIDEHIDIKSIVRRTGVRKTDKPDSTGSHPRRWPKMRSHPKFKVGIAKDAAFQFCYEDTLDLIRQRSGEVYFFSPIKDKSLPDDLDWIYIPGGYPELYAKQLSANTKMKDALTRFSKARGILAECGGLMYMGKFLTDSKGIKHSMLGLFNFSTTLKESRLTLGYRNLKSKQLPALSKLKGHEFHFSRFESNKESAQFEQEDRKRGGIVLDGYIKRKCLAFYSHMYWGASPKTFDQVLTLLMDN